MKKLWFKLPPFIRLFVFRKVKAIIEIEGLTPCDIREVAGTSYIVDAGEQWYKINAAPNPTPKKAPAHNLSLIK